jgi:peptide/nickel transport system ATP-binding protein
VALSTADSPESLRVGCRFADRCPRVMDVCRQVEPPDLEVDERLVKCHLYDGSAPMPAAEPAGVVTAV